MKQCNDCKEWKDLSAFSKCRNYKDGLDYYCKECKSIRYKLFRLANKDKLRERQRKYGRANPDKRQAYNKTYRAKNPGKSTETSRAWHKNHPEQSKIKSREDARKWRENNPEESRIHTRKSVRKWRENNPEEAKARQRRRRAQKLGNGGLHTATQWKALCNHYGNKCLACGEIKPLTEDHIIPLSKGGSDDISNIQPLCHSCNARKHNKTIDYRY